MNSVPALRIWLIVCFFALHPAVSSAETATDEKARFLRDCASGKLGKIIATSKCGCVWDRLQGVYAKLEPKFDADVSERENDPEAEEKWVDEFMAQSEQAFTYCGYPK